MAKHGRSPLDDHLDAWQEGVVVFAALPLLVLIAMLSGVVRVVVLAIFAIVSAAVFCYHLNKWLRRDKSDGTNNTDHRIALLLSGGPCTVTLVNLVASRTVWRAVDAILIVVNVGLLVRTAFRIVRAEGGQYEALPSGPQVETV